MKKLGTTEKGFVVSLSNNEFAFITNNLVNIKEGEDIDISWLKSIIKLFETNKKELDILSTQASCIISSINKIKENK
jgi:hypothetical protein